jgi:arylsulfatase
MPAKPDERPSFLIFMTEQHRGDCLGIDGHPVLLTPNMDEIGGKGCRFTRAYSTCPVCVPARRSFLTGQFPSTHRFFGNVSIEWDDPTLASELSKAGYHTCWVGRSMHQTPPRKRYGFDHVVMNDHREPFDDYEEWMAAHQPPGGGGYYGTGVMHNDWTARPWHMDESLHHTNWTVNLALDFLRKRDPSCPFLLCVSFVAAHPPLIPPACYMERYLRTGVPDPAIGDWATAPEKGGLGGGVSPRKVKLTAEALLSARAGYYGLINHLDDQIHRLLNNVTGVDRMTGSNTVVIFCSDHGEMLGDHYCWAKSLPYEGAARIPLMIRAPERFGIRPGRVSEKPVGLEDIMPTVLDMADVPVPETVDGQSLLPLMRGEDANWRESIQIECATGFQCLTDGREKYVWFTADGREQFFDLTQDPSELHDLINAPERAERVAWWRARLVEELKDRPEGFSDGQRLIPAGAR